jgi:hypothetical protein
MGKVRERRFEVYKGNDPVRFVISKNDSSAASSYAGARIHCGGAGKYRERH